jgi:predicted RNA-binding Zn-ribbon protein involved in translation (DUF1610 family)
MECFCCGKSVFKPTNHYAGREKETNYKLLCKRCGQEVFDLKKECRTHFDNVGYEDRDGVWLDHGKNSFWGSTIDQVKARQPCPQCGEHH